MTALREGFTTGSCAAAAALASCLWQAEGACPRQVELVLPDGRSYRPDIIACEYPWCGVIKDAGDDPDITNGVEILARVDVSDSQGEITFCAGDGVGIVTQPGLKVAIGEAAINPVPRRMIGEAVRRVYPAQALKITVSIPGGAEIARRTFNPRLGIEGGLSVLGTTGVVRPMSEDAIRDTIELEIRMQRAKGNIELALTFGNQGEGALAAWNPALHGRTVQMSNYVGFSLDAAREQGFRRALIGGHPGKLVKLSTGVMQTHSSVADARKEPVIAHLALMGAPIKLLSAVDGCLTTEAMLPLIEQAGYVGVWDRLADAAQKYCEARVRREMEIDIAFLTGSETALGKSARLREDEDTWRIG